MLKSELIASIAKKQLHLQQKDVELAVNNIVEILTSALSNGERIEIRGFGSVETVSRKPRQGRNPKTGEQVSLPSRNAIHFKPGLELKNRVNGSRQNYPKIRDQ